MKTKSYDIFLSYPRKDKKAGDKVTGILQENGFTVWYDMDALFAGDSYVDVICNSIVQSKVVVAIYSTWAIDSEWFRKELEYAQKEDIPIIKVLTDTLEGLSGARRMTFGTMLEMESHRFEEKLLSLVMSHGIHPDTTKIYLESIVQREQALREHDTIKERESFLRILRIAELGNKEAALCVETQIWNVDLLEAVSQYRSINSYFVEDLRTELFDRGKIIAEDETLTDNSQRGRGMEQAAFRFMKRAIDLGYNGCSPFSYYWSFLNENDFEACLNQLGESSRIHLKEQREIPHNVKNMQENQNSETPYGITNDLDCKIFISYKRLDKERVFKIKDFVEHETGCDCWIDLDGIESDAQFANVIIKAINNAQIFLFMYSHFHAEIEDYDTDWTIREINFAQRKKKRIVFVNIDGSPLTDWFELMFGTKQQIDASSNTLMKRLCKDLKNWLK